MRTISGLLVVLLITASAATLVYGQNCSVSIDGIQSFPPSLPGDYASPGGIVKIHIRFTNPTDGYFSPTNAFILYSPWGASWTDSAIVGNYQGANLGPIGIDTTGFLSRAQFPSGFTIRTFNSGLNADGITPDTVSYVAGATAAPYGIPPGFDGRVFTIILQTKWADSNKVICIDSVNHPTSGRKWEWTRINPGGTATVQPTWSGPRCFTLMLGCGFGGGYIDNCPTAPITVSHCATASYQFTGHIAQGSHQGWWLLGGPGSIGHVSGLWQAPQLAPGEYTVVIGSTADEGPASGALASPECFGSVYATCRFHLSVVDNAITAFDPPLTVVTPGRSTSVGIPVAPNDCDTLIFFSVVDSGGSHGSFVITDSLHRITYTPAPEDSLLPKPFITRVKASNPWGASDTATVRWFIHSNCSETVGNIDCNYTESVDIGDLTALIDNLFITFSPLCAPGEANCDGDPLGNVDIGDLTALIDNLFITFSPLPACQ